MNFNIIILKNKKSIICYNLKYKLNTKYKKIIKYNKYFKIYNPRYEFNNNKIFTKKLKIFSILK